MNYLAQYRRYVEIKAAMAVKEEKAHVEELLIIQEFFLVQQKPLKFNPYDRENVVMDGERSFEQLCLTLQENGMHGVKKMTEFEFYNSLIYFQKKYEKLK